MNCFWQCFIKVTQWYASQRRALGQIPRKHKLIYTGENAPLSVAHRQIHAKSFHREVWAVFTLLDKLLWDSFAQEEHHDQSQSPAHIQLCPAQGSEGSSTQHNNRWDQRWTKALCFLSPRENKPSACNTVWLLGWQPPGNGFLVSSPTFLH